MSDKTHDETAFLADIARRQQRNWPAQVPRDVAFPYGEAPVSEYLRARAREQRDATAIVFYGRRVTYGELDDWSDRCAALLHARGVRAGDRVGMMLGNCPQVHIVFYGILKLGAVYVPVNPLFKEAELLHELNDAGVQTLIVQDSLVPLVRSVEPVQPVRALFSTHLGAWLPARPEIALPAGLDAPYQPAEGVENLLDLLAAQASPAPRIDPDPDAPAALNYTGGTTGLPKGCIHTQRDMVYTLAAAATMNGVLGADGRPVDPNDVSLNFLPMFWIAGENAGLLMPIVSGTPLVLLARWDPLAFLQAVERYRVAHVFLVVDNALELMARPDFGSFDLRSLKSARVASFVRKLTPEIRAQWLERTGTVMAEGAWGMTETHTSDTFTNGMQEGDRDLLGRPGFVGLPMPGTHFKICDFDTGELLPLGAEGEIVVRTPSLFKGYWNRPDATAEAVRDGWFHTGDIGAYDEEGCLHYLGRRKEMLKVKGMSVFPSEIEALLGFHPEVLGSAVVGRADADKGQVPVAFVRLQPGAQVDAEALRAWCKAQMATYKVPEIRIVDAWPMTATGKVQKHKLQEEVAQG
ncbi:AMP-binding protein [Verticiella sediminum]|uniref:AMP-binding protein n=1 Tax=Verticiella sediminum TaxID=1247510 RepID=A0A556AKI7_9BURK|nr:AMP-binding protein [Verticiella sediminum]TSH93412.1 AMP-binding protein [Verticiella sediminum]